MSDNQQAVPAPRVVSVNVSPGGIPKLPAPAVQVTTAGLAGENLTVSGLDAAAREPGSILELDGGVVLEVTRLRKPCYVLDAIDPALKDRIAGRCGAYARVLRQGRLSVDQRICLRAGGSVPSVASGVPDTAIRG